MAYSALVKEPRTMSTRVNAHASALVVAAGLFFGVAIAAYAGAPLKGVDVKLGKAPGGGASARTTNAEGKIDLGVLEAGSYYLIVGPPKNGYAKDEPDVLVEIHGTPAGTVARRWNHAQKRAFEVTTQASARSTGTDRIV